MIPTNLPVPLSSRYPDPSVETLHRSFGPVRLSNAGIERLAAG